MKMIVYTIAQSVKRLNVGFFAGCGVAFLGLQKQMPQDRA
ncbi:hypothetical protein LTSEMIS_4759 [Salmonella enterica subsp. enterica serovar Mississippi str. A4-633]|nr:hypothetical protein LTSEMIS_4759 [Salmonella enterica subsp. enterica serovar Mississippi str. A4-633]